MLKNEHNCVSSGRRFTGTPSSGWVVVKALPLLMKKPQMGAKELQTKLQDKWNCLIKYETVWFGKEKALSEIFGTWEESFQLLWSWKAAVLEKMLDSVSEIDTPDEEVHSGRKHAGSGYKYSEPACFLI